jgi:hypothetical protein
VISDLSEKSDNADFLHYLGELFVKNEIPQVCFDELQIQLGNSRSILSNIPDDLLSRKLSDFMSSFDGKIDSLSNNLFPNFLALK